MDDAPCLIRCGSAGRGVNVMKAKMSLLILCSLILMLIGCVAYAPPPYPSYDYPGAPYSGSGYPYYYAPGYYYGPSIYFDYHDRGPYHYHRW